MEWSLTQAEPNIPVVDTALDDHLRRNLVMTNLEDMLAWGRKTPSGRSILDFHAAT